MSNRLAGEISPYLLQHKDNPVDWYPWGEEALAAARDLDRPIFLSIGYAACHWCHVMAHESFEDPETARLLNQHFISIKVDREERPDLDSVYMDAVVAMTGQGGWPMSVFLTSDGRPFFAGTYFPPTPRHGLPAFREILLAIANAWRSDRQRLLDAAGLITERLTEAVPLSHESDDLDPEVLFRARDVLLETYDHTLGGWGGAPKFPQATAVEFLLRMHARAQDGRALDAACHALRRMAQGGIHDVLGGGFHRYAVDAAWHVPHFEKMLYDNALLSRAYLHAWQVSGAEEFRRVAESTLDFLLAELRHPQGGFFSSLDADSEGQEGRFYTWAPGEIEQTIRSAPAAALLAAAYGLSDRGDSGGLQVLHRVRQDADLAREFGISKDEVSVQLNTALAALRARRAARPRPARDEKVLTSWNGLALTALAEAARALDRRDYLEAAQACAAFLLRHLQRDGALYRCWRDGALSQRAFLDDHAALAQGLLALYSADFDLRWYSAAALQADAILAEFASPSGGFFDARADHATPLARPQNLVDSAVPNGNALAVDALLRLAALTGDSRYWAAAEAPLRALQPNLSRHPLAFASWLCALDFAIGPQQQLALVGDPDSDTFRRLAEAAAHRYAPNLVVAGGRPDQPGAPLLLRQPAPPSGALAYLCQGFTCRLPTDSPDVLSAALEASSTDPAPFAPG